MDVENNRLEQKNFKMWSGFARILPERAERYVPIVVIQNKTPKTVGTIK